MTFATLLPHGRRGPDGLVVRLAAAGGEVNFPCRTAQAGGNVLASLEQCLSSCLSDVVDAGGIAVVMLHAIQAMVSCMVKKNGNPYSVHHKGQAFFFFFLKAH